jgi:spermidine/putrescine transport system ATP-binding protein
MPAAAVELLNVCKTIGGRRILDCISLTIHVGEFFALLGPSGCGKTTTLRLLAGFDQPSAGSIRLGGRSVDGVPPYQRDVNLVFQNYALFPHLTVWRNIAFGLEMQRLPAAAIAARTAEVLGLVQLHGLERRYPHQLSGGEQQRVALARAIARQPSVLLLDEPLAALDLHLRRAMRWELKSLQRRLGIAFVYVTHDQEEALTMADRLAVMHGGRVLQVGSPAEIYERPTSRLVASFIGEMNFFSGHVVGVEKATFCVQWSRTVIRVHANSEARVAPGESVTVVVRPEKIVLGRTPLPEYENALAATVEETAYLGTAIRHVVRSEDGHVLCALQQNLESQPQFRPGDVTYACFAGQSAHVIQDPQPYST